MTVLPWKTFIVNLDTRQEREVFTQGLTLTTRETIRIEESPSVKFTGAFRHTEYGVPIFARGDWQPLNLLPGFYTLKVTSKKTGKRGYTLLLTIVNANVNPPPPPPPVEPPPVEPPPPPPVEPPPANTHLQRFIVGAPSSLPCACHDHHASHAGIIKLMDVPYQAVAIKTGLWSDATTWENSKLPSDSDNVLIPKNLTVFCDLAVTPKYRTVTIKGTLAFTDWSNQIFYCDTMIVDLEGTKCAVGLDGVPRLHDLVFQFDNRILDLDSDPEMVSHGLIVLGTRILRGKVKSHSCLAKDSFIGSSIIEFDADISTWESWTGQKFNGKDDLFGWKSDDLIVIGGTEFIGYPYGDSNGFNHNELRKIYNIINKSITLDKPLNFSHVHKNPDLPGFNKIDVINLTRSISYRGLEGSRPFERAHVMVMMAHYDETQYIEYSFLGRTDKSKTSKDLSNISPLTFESNIKGRYPIHYHMMADFNDRIYTRGCSVFDSPGLGMVQHGVKAKIEEFVSHRTFGAGLLSENGEEYGHWKDCVVMGMIGTGDVTHKGADDAHNNDWGRDCLYSASSRQLAIENIRGYGGTKGAAGFVWINRGSEQKSIAYDLASPNTPNSRLPWKVRNNTIPLNVKGLIFRAVYDGYHVIKETPEQDHYVRSILENVDVRMCRYGAVPTYTAHYNQRNHVLIGYGSQVGFQNDGIGFLIGGNASDMVAENFIIAYFDTAVSTEGKFPSGEMMTPEQAKYFGINFKIFNCNRKDLPTNKIKYIERPIIKKPVISINSIFEVGVDVPFTGGAVADSIGSYEVAMTPHESHKMTYHTLCGIVYRNGLYYDSVKNKYWSKFIEYFDDRIGETPLRSSKEFYIIFDEAKWIRNRQFITEWIYPNEIPVKTVTASDALMPI